MLTARLDAGGGGVVTSAAGLARALGALGHDVHAVGLDGGAVGIDSTIWDGITIHRERGALAAARAVRRLAPDAIHQHGLWTRASLAARRLARRGTPCVVSPHGMLDPWALALGAARAKRLMLALHERRHLERASCVHALGPAERDSLAALGLGAPVALVPNGIDVGSAPAGSARALPPGVAADAPFVLYLGRLAPIKGLDQTLDAWSALDPARRGPWRLVVAGFDTDERTRAVERRLARADPEVASFVGPAHGETKRALLAHAGGFVLASRGEGQPMAALEAMGAGVPALLSDACNLPDAFAADAALRVPTDAAGLAEAFARFLALTDERRHALGERGRAFVADGYAWDSVGRRFAELYRWTAGGAPRPGFVVDAARAPARPTRGEPGPAARTSAPERAR